MGMDAGEMEGMIKASIPDAQVTIRDLAGDGDHYAATVIAESFRGKSRVQQRQIAYEALKGEMGGKLHALALQTGTPERPLWLKNALVGHSGERVRGAPYPSRGTNRTDHEHRPIHRQRGQGQRR